MEEITVPESALSLLTPAHIQHTIKEWAVTTFGANDPRLSFITSGRYLTKLQAHPGGIEKLKKAIAFLRENPDSQKRFITSFCLAAQGFQNQCGLDELTQMNATIDLVVYGFYTPVSSQKNPTAEKAECLIKKIIRDSLKDLFDTWFDALGILDENRHMYQHGWEQFITTGVVVRPSAVLVLPVTDLAKHINFRLQKLIATEGFGAVTAILNTDSALKGQSLYAAVGDYAVWGDIVTSFHSDAYAIPTATLLSYLEKLGIVQREDTGNHSGPAPTVACYNDTVHIVSTLVRLRKRDFPLNEKNDLAYLLTQIFKTALDLSSLKGLLPELIMAEDIKPLFEPLKLMLPWEHALSAFILANAVKTNWNFREWDHLLNDDLLFETYYNILYKLTQFLHPAMDSASRRNMDRNRILCSDLEIPAKIDLLKALYSHANPVSSLAELAIEAKAIAEKIPLSDMDDDFFHLLCHPLVTKSFGEKSRWPAIHEALRETLKTTSDITLPGKTIQFYKQFASEFSLSGIRAENEALTDVDSIDETVRTNLIKILYKEQLSAISANTIRAERNAIIRHSRDKREMMVILLKGLYATCAIKFSTADRAQEWRTLLNLPFNTYEKSGLIDTVNSHISPDCLTIECQAVRDMNATPEEKNIVLNSLLKENVVH